MSSRSEIENLISRYQRRLQKLKEQKATTGINVPPEILTEIEDIEAKIKDLQIEFEQLAPEMQEIAPFSPPRPPDPQSLPQMESDRGVISRADLLESDERKAGEVFAIELLTEPITLERKDGRTVVKIDRRNVSQCIVTNAGKTAAVLKYVAGNEEELMKEDMEIQRFLIRTHGDGFKTIDLENLNIRLRWASGGALSIVTFDGEDYVSLRFRDIRPYGWNLTLGSSERCFHENGKVNQRFGIEDEWDNPLDFIRREFLEELLVIDRAPTPGKITLERLLVLIALLFVPSS